MAIFTYIRLTQFAESDAAGIIHFSRYGTFVEEAEHAFLYSRGFPVVPSNPSAFCWPRVQFQANFQSPLLPLERIHITLHPQHVGRTSLTWRWVILRKDQSIIAAAGEMKTVCCLRRGVKLEPVPLPPPLRDFLVSGADSSRTTLPTNPAG